MWVPFPRGAEKSDDLPGYIVSVLRGVSLTEAGTAVMIFSLGSLLFTFLVKVVIAIIFGNYNIGSIQRKEESETIQA